MDNNKVIAIELVIVAFLVALTFFIDIPRVDALSVTQSKAEPHYAVINDAPFFITVDKVNATHMTVTLTVKEGNRTLDKTGTLDAKKQLISSAKSMLSSNKVAAKDLKDGYKEQVTFAWKSGDTFKWGYNSSSVTISGASPVVVNNGEFSMTLLKGTVSYWYDIYGMDWVTTEKAYEWDLRTSTYNGGSWFSSSVASTCYYDGTNTSFVTPVMSTVTCTRDDGAAVQEYTFYSGSNMTDIYLKAGSIDYMVGAQTFHPTLTWQDGDDATNISNGAGNINTGTASTYIGGWDSSDTYHPTLAILWHYDAAVGKLEEVNLQALGSESYINNCRGASGIYGCTGNDIGWQTRMGFTDASKGINPISSIQKEWSKFNSAATITNTTGGCVNYYDHGGTTSGSGDVFKCFPASNVLKFTVTPNANITRIWLDVDSFTSNDIYLYKNTVLQAHITNVSGGWNYSGTGCGSDVSINSGVCNTTGVWDVGTGKRFFAVMDVSGATTIEARNTTAAVPPAVPQWLSYGSSFNCTPWAFFNSTWDALDSCNFESNFTGSLVNVSGTILGTTCYFDSAADNNIAIMWRFIVNSTEGRMFSQNSTPWDYLTPSCEAPPSLPNITGNCTSCFKPTHEMTRLNSVCLDADRMMVNYGSIMCANGICNNFTSADVVLCSNGCDSDLGACRPDAAVSVAIFAAILISLAIGAYLVWRWV
jgi:hypothetical protein